MAVVTRADTSPSHAVAPAEPTAAATQRGRDLRIDFLRGLCVIGMIVDHVAGPSWLYAITGGNHFYTSAAEGFVFVSGLVAGRAYTRFIDREGLAYGLGRLLGRAGQLYLLAIALTFVVVPVSEWLRLPWALGWNLQNALDFVVSVVTLHRTYYLVDVMPLYVLVLLTSTVVFVLLLRGKALFVLGASWLLWLLYQIYPDYAAMPWPIVGNNLFYFSAWQVLFFTGVVMGHCWERRQASPRLISLLENEVWRRRVLIVGAAALAVLIAVYAMQERVLDFAFRNSPEPAAAQAQLITSVVGKSDLRWGRLLTFALVFTVFFLATTRWWAALRRWLGWFVVPLGQNALFAYSIHVLIAVGVAAYAVHRLTGGIEAIPAWKNAAIQIGTLGVVWCLVQLRPLRAAFGVRQVRVLVPAALGLLALAVLPRLEFAGTPATATAADSAGSPSEQLARAYGTVIPPNVEPAIPAAALAPPVQEGTAGPGATPARAATPAPGSTPTPARAAATAGPTVQAAPAISSAAGQLQGKLMEPEFMSTALKAKERYFIYLPPDAQQSGRRLPVLYMLHGGGGRQEWVDYGLISMTDKAIAAGTLPPMIIVLPQGDQGYWVNHIDGGPQWGDYLQRDLVQHIDATYPTQADAKHRAVGGMSMGGWGALYQAFTHPDEFGVVGAHAPSLRGGDGSMPFLPRGSAFAQYDPRELANNAPNITGLRVYLDADEQDPWVKPDADLHNRLDQRHIANEWHVFPGRHGGTYWHDHIPDYLQFYGRALASP